MTIDEVFCVAGKSGLIPKRWGGTRLLTYNGFTHEQRVRKWRALDLAIRMGLEKPAEHFPCSVCGAPPSSSIAYHSEDYGSMQGHYPVCRSCHTKIHNRFKNPARWRQFAATVGTGNKWFERLNCNDGATPVTDITLLPGSEPSKKTDEVKMSSPTDNTISLPGNARQEMHAIRIAFVKAMGIKSKEMNPNPIGGYKLEHNYAKRQENLTEARRLRNVYAELVKIYGFGQDVLDKMDSNLANRDRSAEWR